MFLSDRSIFLNLRLALCCRRPEKDVIASKKIGGTGGVGLLKLFGKKHHHYTGCGSFSLVILWSFNRYAPEMHGFLPYSYQVSTGKQQRCDNLET